MTLRTTTSLFFALALSAPALAQDAPVAGAPAPAASTAPAADATAAPAAAAPARDTDATELEAIPPTPSVKLTPPTSIPALPGAAPTPEPAEPIVSVEPTPSEEPEPPAESPVGPKEGRRLLVMDLVDNGVGEVVVNAVNQSVQGQSQKSFVGEVVTSEQLRVTLDANALQQMVGCDSENCMADLGKRVDADVVLGGNVARVANDLLITVVAIDPSTGKQVGSAQRKVAEHEDLFYYASRQLTALALTGRTVDPTVPVRVLANENGARIVVDGRDVGETPMTVPLDPGSHEIEVLHEDYAPWRIAISVEEATPMEVRAELTTSGFPLWPVAMLFGGIGGAFGMGSAALTLVSLQRLYGFIPGVEAVPLVGGGLSRENSYFGAKVRTTNKLQQARGEAIAFALAADVVGAFFIFFSAIGIILHVTEVTFWALEE